MIALCHNFSSFVNENDTFIFFLIEKRGDPFKNGDFRKQNLKDKNIKRRSLEPLFCFAFWREGHSHIFFMYYFGDMTK